MKRELGKALQRRRSQVLLIAIAATLSRAGLAAAQDNWNAGSGNWSMAGNWNPPNVPAAGDTVNVVFTDGLNRIINYDYTGAAVTLGSLTLDLTNFSGTAASVLSMSANNLTANSEYIGNYGTGAILQTGGVNTANYTLELGNNVGGAGMYMLSGTGSLSVSGNEYVANSGVGIFSQSGAANSITTGSSLIVGNNSGATGTYTLGGGGSLSVTGNEQIGFSGNGSLTQSSGTNVVGLTLSLGNNTGGSGTYTLSGGSLSVSGNEYVANGGVGNFSQSGATNSITTGSSLIVGNNSGATGTYTLGGGGSLSVTGNEQIGFSGNGTLTQSSGTNVIGLTLSLGNNTGGSGTYTLSGGSLSVSGNEYVANSGVGNFSQNGAANSITTGSSLIVGNNSGAAGTYALGGGGSLTVTGNEQIGFSGNGSLTQSSGANVVGLTLSLGNNTGGSGTYTLSGGSLSVSGNEYVGGNGAGSFVQTGGANNAPNFILGASGTYSLMGGTAATSGIVNAGNVSIGTAGSLTVNGNYSQAAGATVVNGVLNISGQTAISGGSFTLDYTSASAPVTGGSTSLIMGGATLTLTTGAQPLTETFATTTFTGGTNIITAGAGTTLQLGQFGNAVTTGGVTTVNTTVTRAITSFGATVQFNGPVTGTFSPFQVISNVTFPTILATPNPVIVSGTASMFNSASGIYSGYATYGTSDWAAVTASTNGTSYIVPGSTIAGFYTTASSQPPTIAPTGPLAGDEIYMLADESTAPANDDVDVTGIVRFDGDNRFTSIRFNSPMGGNTTVGQGTPVDQLFINFLAEGSAYLETPNVGANNVIISDINQSEIGASSTTTGDLNISRGGAQDMVIWQNNTLGLMVLATGISDTKNGGGGLTKAGPGVLALTGNSTYTGATNIQGGTLEIAGNTSLGSFTTIQANVNLDNGVLIATGTTTLDNAGYSSTTAARNMILGPHGGTVAAVTGASMTIDGNISGSGGLTVGGGLITQAIASPLTSTIAFSQTLTNGTIVLTGTNTYTGNTVVSGGLLQADGAFSSPNFTVNSGAALSGVLRNSTPNVTVNSGGTLYAGDAGTGGINVQSLTLNAGSNLSFAIASNPLVTTDPVTVIGSSGLSLLGTNGSPIDLSIFSQGSTNGFHTSGTYTLLAESGLNAFNINGTLAAPSGGASETTSTIGGLLLVNPQGFTTYSLLTVPVGGNTTDLELQVAGPQVSQWGNTGGGSYQNANNWSPPVVPSGSGATANFASAIVAPSTVTVDSQLTVGNIIFNNSHSYTLASGIAGSTVDLDNDAGPASIADYLGTHFISVPLTNPLGLNVTVSNTPDAVNVSSVISGSGGVTMNGSGTLVLAASNTYSGLTAINSGTIQLGNGSSNGTLGSSAASIVDNGNLAFDQASGTTQTVTNVLTASAAGGLSQIGAGSLIVLSPTGSNTLNPISINVAAGTLRIGNANAVNLGGLDLSGGVLDLNGINTNFNNLSGSGGIIDSLTGSGLIDLSVGADNTSTTFAGIIRNTSGTVSLQKLGNGVLVLSGVNTYTGPTNIVNGGLRLTQSNSLNTASQLQVNSLGFFPAGALILSNGVTLANPIVTNTSAFEFVNLPDANSTATLTGPISSVAGSQFRLGFPSTSSTLILTDTITVPAAQIVDLTQGNLIFNGNSSINTSSSTVFLGRSTTDPLTLVMNNNSSINNPGTVGMTIGGGVNEHQVSITLNNASSLNAGTGDFELNNSTVGNAVSSLTLNGGILTAGSFTFTPAAATASATVNFNGGVVTAAASGTNFLPVNSKGTLALNIGASGAAFNTNGFNEVIASPPGFNSYNGTSGSTGGGLIKYGPGQLVVASGFGASAAVDYANFTAYTGATVVDDGLLEFANGTQNGQLSGTSHITVASGGAVGVDSGSTSDTAFLALMTNKTAPASQQGALALSPADDFVNINYVGVVSGDFNMSKPVSSSSTSFASMSLGATANFNGTTYAPTIYAGRITPANHQYLLGGGGTLELAQTSTGAPLVDVSGATSLLAENGGDVLLVTTNTYTGPTTITATNVLTEPAANLPSGVAIFTLEPTTLSVSKLVDTGSGIGLSAVGTPSNLIINGGVFQYVGTTATSDRLFTIGAMGATLDGSGTGAITFAANGAEAFSAAGSTSLNLTGTYGAVASGKSHQNSLVSLLSDPSGGTLSVTKNGPGAWALANPSNTYSGGTTVNAGVLQAGGTAAAGLTPGAFGSPSGAMVVNAGGTLDLDGNNISVGALSGGGLIDNIVIQSASPVLTVGTGNATSTFSGIIQNTSGTVNLISTGSGVTLLAGNNTYTGTTTISAGNTLQLGTNGTSGEIGAGNVLNSGSLIINRSDTAGFVFANNVSGPGAVSNVGSGTVTFSGSNSYGGITTESSGTLVIASAAGLPVGNTVVDNAVLSIQAGSGVTPVNPAKITGSGAVNIGATGVPAYLRLGATAGAQSMSSISSLSIAPGSTLDVTNNALVINYGSPANDPAASVRAALMSGYNGDTWTGPGIVSSNAAANPSLYAVGYADGNTDVATPAAANQIYIQNTLAGDANLDGIVNFPDLLVVAQDYGKTGEDWAHGDFNYDGIVNFPDLLLVAQNYGKQLSAGELAELPGSFAAQWELAESEIQDAAIANNVPEPATISLFAVASAAILLRRRRK